MAMIGHQTTLLLCKGNPIFVVQDEFCRDFTGHVVVSGFVIDT